MDGLRDNMDRTRIECAVTLRTGPGHAPMDKTEILFHTPGPAEAAFPYHVLAAGLTITGPQEPPIRRRYRQHVLILTLEGCGVVSVADREWMARAGSLTWLDTAGDYAHCCAAGSPHWRYLWIGAQGFGLDRLCAGWQAASGPVAALPDATWAERLFRQILDEMRSRGPAMAARCSRDVAALVALRRDAILPVEQANRPGRPALAMAVLPRLSGDLARRWTAEAIAGVAGLSPSQLRRLFRAETGLSPLSWLRRERITLAKTLLLDHRFSIQDVADAVGYPDPFHFSRDFRALTGRAPRAFRQDRGT